MQIRRAVSASFLLYVVSAVHCVAHPPNMSVLLGPAIKSETVQIEYMLVGKFGGYGGFVRSRSGLSAYDIPIVVDGTPAVNIKFFIWAPGCRMAAFDISLLGAVEVQRTYACVPLGTTTLAGMVPKELVTSSSEITVAYVAHWSCDFFGLKDCMVPTMSLRTIRPDADGVFRIELPDFSDDPVASQSAGGAEFLVQFRGANTMPLEPGNLDFRTATHGLKIAHKYPAKSTISRLESRDSPLKKCGRASLTAETSPYLSIT